MTDFVLRPPERLNYAKGVKGSVEPYFDRAHLSHSSLDTLLACEKRFELHYELGLRPATTKQSLALGRGFASALEHADPNIAYAVVHKLYEREAQLAGNSPWIVLPTPAEVEIGATIAREAARAYLKQYGSHTETRELEMRVRIRNPAVGGRYSLTHDLLGRVDAVDLDQRILVEDKLSGSTMRGAISQRVRIDRQISIGCYLVWRSTGIMIESVKFRLTMKPAIKQRKGESHDAFLQRIADDYHDRPDHYLIEQEASRGESDFLTLERELWRWAEAVRSARRDGTWPRNTSACLDFGGCHFLPLCSGEPGADNLFRVDGNELAKNELEAA